MLKHEYYTRKARDEILIFNVNIVILPTDWKAVTY